LVIALVMQTDHKELEHRSLKGGTCANVRAVPSLSAWKQRNAGFAAATCHHCSRNHNFGGWDNCDEYESAADGYWNCDHNFGCGPILHFLRFLHGSADWSFARGRDCDCLARERRIVLQFTRCSLPRENGWRFSPVSRNGDGASSNGSDHRQDTVSVVGI
jgi:hypothetical protein